MGVHCRAKDGFNGFMPHPSWRAPVEMWRNTGWSAGAASVLMQDRRPY